MAKVLAVSAGVFLTLTLLYNINSDWPKIPGDLYIDRPGLRVYIPFVSALVVSIILTLIFNFFSK